MMALMRESKITREMIEAHLGCRFEWYVNGRQPHSIVFARLWPLPGQSLEEMVACWNEHGWRLAHDYENSTTESAALIQGQAGQYVKLYADKQRTHLFLPFLGRRSPYVELYADKGRTHLFLPFWGHRSHYLCQHWWDPLPDELWWQIHNNFSELRHIPLVDISVKGEGIIFTATLHEVSHHFTYGTSGDVNLPILKVVDIWRKARGGV